MKLFSHHSSYKDELRNLTLPHLPDLAGTEQEEIGRACYSDNPGQSSELLYKFPQVLTCNEKTTQESQINSSNCQHLCKLLNSINLDWEFCKTIQKSKEKLVLPPQRESIRCGVPRCGVIFVSATDFSCDLE